MVIAYQDEQARTATSLTGSITIGKQTSSIENNKGTEEAWGYSNFSNTKNGIQQTLGNLSVGTSFNPLADLKCTTNSFGYARCEIGISSDYYSLVKSRSKLTIEIGGITQDISVMKSHPDGWDSISIAGKKQNNVMFYSLYEAKTSDLYALLTSASNQGKTYDFRIYW